MIVHNPAWVVAVAGVVYGCAAFLVVQLSAFICNGVVPFEDGPRPGHPPTAILIGGAALIGLSLGWQGAQPPALGIILLLVAALVACWYTDVRCGIVPDYFTLIPLGVVLAISLIDRNAAPLVSAVVVFVPFALAAFFSKGRGMGWGDVKLVALGAAVLGLQSAMLAFAAACLLAVAVAALRNRRSEPIAFAPYLAGAVAFAITIPVFPR